jgi:hypothetical protein
MKDNITLAGLKKEKSKLKSAISNAIQAFITETGEAPYVDVKRMGMEVKGGAEHYSYEVLVDVRL